MVQIRLAIACAAIFAMTVPIPGIEDSRHFLRRGTASGQGLPGSYCRAPPGIAIVAPAVGESMWSEMGWSPYLLRRLNLLLTAKV